MMIWAHLCNVYVFTHRVFARGVSISVSFTKFGSNIGFGRANNEGLSFALEHGYDSVFLLNQDCRIQSDMFLSLRSFGLTNKENVTCPIQLNWNGIGANLNFSARYAPDWASHKEPFEVDFVNHLR